MNPIIYTEANRQMWNATAEVHAQVRGQTFMERVQAPDFSTFRDVEKIIFAEIGLQGKDVVQLASNKGREIISVKKAGARRCVGFDISDGFIAQARELAQVCGVEVEFVRSSVYDIPHAYDEQFDLAYVTIGVMGWLQDLDGFFGVIARLLKPGGQLFMYEMHPILNMFEPAKGLEIQDSYFRTEPFVEHEGPDYLDPTKIVKGTSYWFPHTLGDVIGGCLKHKLLLTHFQEYGHDISAAYAAFEHFEHKPPLSFSLVARKG